MTDMNTVAATLATDPVIDSALAATVPVDPAATPAVSAADPATKGPSPLDVLDQILNEAQTKATDNIQKQEEEEKKLIAAEFERQRKEDQERIAKQIIDLQKMKQSPEYLARVEQLADEEQKEEAYEQKMDGMQIIQLAHTKI